jgi:hypothetical protein
VEFVVRVGDVARVEDGIAPPGSVAARGLSLDIITLPALAQAVRIVIDDAIEVLENIRRSIEEKGYSPVKAAILATKDIGLGCSLPPCRSSLCLFQWP